MTEPIIGSQEREEAKAMGTVPDRSKRAEVSFFLRMALEDYDVRIYDPNEGIKVANRFISYLEVLSAVKGLPAHVGGPLLLYYGSDMTQAEAAEEVNMGLRTFQRRLRQGLDEMIEVIWK